MSKLHPAKRIIQKFIALFSYPFSSIVMVSDPRIGFFIILAAFLHPNIILSGLCGLLITIILTNVLHIDRYYQIKTTVYINSILLSLFIGYLYNLDTASFALLVITMGINLIFCFSFDALFSLISLPLLSLPFSVIAILIALSKKKFSALGHANVYFHEFLPEFFEHLHPNINLLLKSFGTFFCIPDPGFGLIILLGVLLYSPIIATFLLSGFFLGLEFDKFFAFSSSQYIHQHYYFNFSLIFAFLAGVFLIPSLYSICWAIFATLMTVLLSTGLSSLFNYADIPVMALPFNLTAFLVLRTLKTVASNRINSHPEFIPEESLENSRLTKLRFANGEIGLFMPVDGEWTIQQGFNGAWTHKGRWQHALDFVISKDGKTFVNQGLDLEDYHAFNRPVYSPVSGYVVAICSSLPDNKIEIVDNQNNWGNYLIIRSLHGFYVQLAHLKKDSINVTLNSFVHAGDKVAHCGNSGYSREPHLHLQVQWFLSTGAYTFPFHLMNFYHPKSGSAIFHGLPHIGDQIAPFTFNHSLNLGLNFKIDEIMKWSKKTSDGKAEEIEFEHKLDSQTGKTYWTDGDSKLFYYRIGARFYFYELKGRDHSPLWDFYTAAPIIPLVINQRLHFHDDLYLKVTCSPSQRIVALFRQLVTGHIHKSNAEYELNPQSLTLNGRIVIKGENIQTHLQLDPQKGIIQFQVGKVIYERI